MEYWAVNSNGTCINAVDGTIATLDEIVGTSSSLYEERTAVNYINGTETMTLTSSPMVTMLYPDYGYISNVPAYVQASGYVCINTSILNVIAYWDNNGLPDLITGTILQARADIEACLVAAGGSGANASIPGAINSYATAHGNYYSDVWNIWYPEFFDLQFEINYGDPCLVGFTTYYGGGHMTTGVGYNIVSGVNYVIVHDNHVSYDVTIAFSEVDFIASISILDLY